MNALTKTNITAAALSVLLLSGCATAPSQTAAIVSSQQVLAAVTQGEGEVKTQRAPGVEGTHPERYRWVNTQFSDMGAIYGWVYNASATVPAGLPHVDKSAIVIIRMPNLGQKAAQLQHYATVTALVCDGQDIACGKRIGSAIDTGELPGFGKPLTPAQVNLAASIGTHGIKTAEAAE